MQEKRDRSRPARRRPNHPHHAPRGINRAYVVTCPASGQSLGPSDGRIYDPRSGYALDWWSTAKPKIYQEPGTETTGIWQVEFEDGGVVCAPGGIHVVAEPSQSHFRVQLPPLPIRSRARTVRRERQAGRRPVRDGCPLLFSVRPVPRKQVERAPLYR